MLIGVQDSRTGEDRGELVEVSPATGQVERTTKIPATGNYYHSRGAPRANGHYVVACRLFNKVIETDDTGQIVWQSSLEGPWDVAATADGNTLVACGKRVVEVDSTGRVAWETISPGISGRVRVCLGAVRLGFPTPTPAGLEAELNRSRLRALRTKDAAVRRNAAQLIMELGPNARGVVPALSELLKDPDKENRWWAAIALESIGPPAKEAIPALLQAMEGGEQILWERHAPDALVSIGPSAIAPLTKAIKENKSATVRAGAAHALGVLANENRDCVATLLEAMKDEDPLVRRQVAWGLQAVRPASNDILRALVQLLEDKDEKVCEDAAAWLATQADKRPWGGKADMGPFVPQLLKAAESLKGAPRAYVLRALGSVGAKDPKVLPTLIERLKDSDDIVVGQTLDGLRQYGPGAESAAAALAELLKTRGPPNMANGGSIQENVAQALAVLGPKAAKDALPVLMDTLRDKKSKDLRFRAEVAIALGAMGPAAKDAVPVLADELKSLDKNQDNQAGFYRECLLQALLGLGDDGAAVVLGLTDAKGEDALAMALWRLQFNPTAAKAAVQGLGMLVKKGSSRQACTAALALAEIGADAKPCEAALRDALKTKDEALRVRAAQALARIEPDARTLVPILAGSLRDAPRDVPAIGNAPTFAAGSAWALGVMGPDAASAVPALVDRLKLTTQPIRANPPGAERLRDYTLEKRSWSQLMLHDLHEDDRACVLVALGRIGANAKEAIPALQAVLQDRDEPPPYRCLAAEALGKIGPSAKIAVPALMRVLKDDENTALLQSYAAEALGNIGADAKEALPLLKEAVTERRTLVRRAAAKSIRAMSP
jgi:HEAT repeat protein